MQLRVLSKQHGQAVVEMTFGFLIFFTIFMSIVEFAHLLYAKVTLQNALRSAGRYMVTGNTTQDGNGKDLPRDEVIHTVFCNSLIAAGVRCPNIGPDFAFSCIDGSCQEPGGGPEQTVMVTVNVIKPPLTPFFSRFFTDGGVPFTFSTTWKNEPYS